AVGQRGLRNQLGRQIEIEIGKREHAGWFETAGGAASRSAARAGGDAASSVSNGSSESAAAAERRGETGIGS
ncbi:hypothetical protein QZN00_29435, partial [Burkholderia multivorans]|nr:hypothetical protein [Burkholderia multivorans]